MLVKELMEVLQDCDEADIVILATDAEGNDYKELADYNETAADMVTGNIYIVETHMRQERYV